MIKLAELKISDLHVGFSQQILKQIRQADIDNFVAITGDEHPLHTDKEYAQSCGYKDIIAHGLLVSSYTSSLIGMKLPGRNALIISEKFVYKAPSFPGDQLTIIGTIKEIDERFSRIRVKIEVRNQEEKNIAVGDFEVMIRD